MARKPVRSRGSLLAGLAKLFERGGIDDLLNDDDLPGDEGPDFEARNDGPITIEDWISSLYGVLAHSGQIEKPAKKLRCKFDAVDLSPGGHVSAICRTSGELYAVHLSIEFLEVPKLSGGCNCERSNEQEPCEHTYRLASYLLAELNDRSSSLRAKITGPGAHTPRPNAPRPSPTRGNRTQVNPAPVKAPPAKAMPQTPVILEQLDHFLATRPSPAREATDGDELPVARLMWKLEVGHQGLTLTPLKERA